MVGEFSFLKNDKKIIKVLNSFFIILFTYLLSAILIQYLFYFDDLSTRKYVNLFLFLLWTSGFLLSYCVKEHKLKLHYYLIFLTYTFFYLMWFNFWGFIPNMMVWRFMPDMIIYVSTILIALFFILISLSIMKNSHDLSSFFQKFYVREFFIFLIIFSFVFLIIKIKYSDIDAIKEKHDNYFSDNNFFPNDYRLLVPYLVKTSSEVFKTFNLNYLSNIPRLYKVYNGIALVLSFYLYYLFLTAFFKRQSAFFISILLLLIFYLSFYVGGVVEDPFNLLFFVLGLFFIYHKLDILMLLLVFVSSFNRETTWFLIFMFFVDRTKNINRSEIKSLIIKTGLMLSIFSSIMLFKFLIKPIKETQINYSIYNFSCEHCNLHLFLILNSFWILAFFFAEYSKKLSFFSRLNFITPFFVLWHYLGLIREVRYFVIIALILLPLGISLLFPDSLQDDGNSKHAQ